MAQSNNTPDLIEAAELALSYFTETRHGREWTNEGGLEAGYLRNALASVARDSGNQPPTPFPELSNGVRQLLETVANSFETAGCEDCGTVSTEVMNSVRAALGWHMLDSAGDEVFPE